MAESALRLTFHTPGKGAEEQSVPIRRLAIAGWTGRNPEAVEKHIQELQALGIRRPATVPIYYRVAAARLTTRDRIDVSGSKSSGEVEFVLLQHAGRLWVGTGSDHTDREVESYGVTVSKQMCEKPIAPDFWAFDTVAKHWDRLTLRSYILEDGRLTLYQEGSVTAMRDPMSLIAGFEKNGQMADGTAMFCVTFAVNGGIRSSDQFDFELEDPVLGHKIRHSYRVDALPVLG